MAYGVHENFYVRVCLYLNYVLLWINIVENTTCMITLMEISYWISKKPTKNYVTKGVNGFV
jgi:hypothetical protein